MHVRAEGFGMRVYLPLVSREWKNGSNKSYNCTSLLHSLLTKGKFKVFVEWFLGLGFWQSPTWKPTISRGKAARDNPPEP